MIFLFFLVWLFLCRIDAFLCMCSDLIGLKPSANFDWLGRSTANRARTWSRDAGRNRQDDAWSAELLIRLSSWSVHPESGSDPRPDELLPVSAWQRILFIFLHSSHLDLGLACGRALLSGHACACFTRLCSKMKDFTNFKFTKNTKLHVHLVELLWPFHNTFLFFFFFFNCTLIMIARSRALFC